MSTTTTKVIGTHDGTFHADEVVACFLLKQTAEYQDARIIRTRDTAKLNECSIVVDVGSEYDPHKNRFDHHQRGFLETLSPSHTMKLSSAGLIYKHFGMEIITRLAASITASAAAASSSSSSTSPPGLSSSSLPLVYEKMYRNFIEPLDAIDNGISMFPASLTLTHKPAYTIHSDLSSRIGFLNAAWNESLTSDQQLQRFERGMRMAGEEFTERLAFYLRSWLPARQIVEMALARRRSTHASGKIVALQCATQWKDHLLTLEEEQGIVGEILYVLYQDESKSWRVQAVPVDADSFQSRCPLLEPWRGIRDQQLSTLSGIPDTIFCHHSGFIGGAKSYESALAMATKSLDDLKK